MSASQPPRATQAPQTSSSYTVLPRLYDRFVALRKSDYGVWLRLVQAVRAQRHLGDEVLSLAAGTCECERDLARLGCRVICADLSQAMLDIARAKLEQAPDREVLEGRVQLVQADMRSFQAPRPVDLVLCHYFAINYLLTHEDLRACFGAARRALRPGGVLLFDTLHNEHFSAQGGTSAQRFIDTPDVTSLQETHYDTDGTIRATLTVFYREGDGYQKAVEEHVQRVYHLAEMDRALHEAGFTQVRRYRYGEQPGEPPRDADKRVVFEASVS